MQSCFWRPVQEWLVTWMQLYFMLTAAMQNKCATQQKVQIGTTAGYIHCPYTVVPDIYIAKPEV